MSYHKQVYMCAKFKAINAFTLAELLVALAILGVIATFSIPKVLNGSQIAQKKAVVKEAASILANAFDAYAQSNIITANTSFVNVLPYINYVKADTTLTIDDGGVYGTSDVCNQPGEPCILLHNGAVVQYNTSAFGGTSNVNAVYFVIDPDGKFTGDGSVVLIRYYSGKITSWKYALPSSQNAGWVFGTGNDPDWFNWN